MDSKSLLSFVTSIFSSTIDVGIDGVFCYLSSFFGWFDSTASMHLM